MSEARETGPDASAAVVATIGVFDGVHRGHRALLEVVMERARQRGVPSMVITFDPHPVTVLAPRNPPHLLTPRRTKLRLLAELGCDRAWVLPFSRDLSRIPAEAFVTRLLLGRLRLRELWVGYDFRFGRDRAGDASLLLRLAQKHGFEAQQFGPVHEGGRVLSSTWVREALQRGEIGEAEKVLGHPFLLDGIVGRGRGEGGKSLVPTANLSVDPAQLLPARGVYTGWAEVDGSLVPSVANIGVRPTLTADTAVTVEVHLIDWQGDLRGRPLGLRLGVRLRPERRFGGLAELREAIRIDLERARDWHRRADPNAGLASLPCPQDKVSFDPGTAGC